MRYGAAMTERAVETAMRRYECDQCEMQATVVDTRGSRDAWADHMATHSSALGFRVWTWTVLQLNFAEGD